MTCEACISPEYAYISMFAGSNKGAAYNCAGFSNFE